MLSDAKKKANVKWDSANMTVVGCRIRKDKAEKFKAVCKEQGTTPNAVFLDVVEQMIKEERK